MDEFYFSPGKIMQMTSPHDSGHKWITNRTKKKLSCMREASPISSGVLFPPSKQLSGAAGESLASASSS